MFQSAESHDSRPGTGIRSIPQQTWHCTSLETAEVAAVVWSFNTRLVSPRPEATWLGVNVQLLSAGMPALPHDRLTLPGKTLPFPSGTMSRL